MKKILLIAIAIIAFIFMIKQCRGEDGRGTSDTEIDGYSGTVESVNGNVLTLTSGLNARLLGVEAGRTDVEMFLRSQFLDKNVTLYTDSKGTRNKYIINYDDTVKVYAVETGKYEYSINRQVVNEYPDAYRQIEMFDSTGWVVPSAAPTEKKNLALYMKQRTFLVQTPYGSGTGFFISEDGLAVTNWHVLSPGMEKESIAVLYQNSPDDSEIYSDKKRNFKNILWSSGLDALDITIMSVELENNEKVPYFNIAKRRPNLGDKVSTFGNPMGMTASYSSGDVSAFRNDPYNPERNVQLMQYNMPTNGGNSGGPVCDVNGEIVAVHELGDKQAQGMNWGIDAMQLREVLDGLGLKYGGKF